MVHLLLSKESRSVSSHVLTLGLALFLCFGASMPVDAAPSVKKPSPSPKLDQEAALIQKVENYLAQIRDFSAQFEQHYTRVALSRTFKERGQVRIKKPGKLRWQYQEPAERLFILNGQELWDYEPEEEQVVHTSKFDPGKYSNAVAFLWGQGKLRDAYQVKQLEQLDPFPKEASLLELVPKEGATYARIVLRVDPKSGQVTESVIFETSGNTNHYRFHDVRLNQGLAETEFQFTPPPGVHVENL